ncbi:hypothetical protein HID58_093978 [Brassica napus]|uniref:Signal peptidase complex catalytic subunit SEC11 n=1 Tax=Brassica napus TaxID=3708 RepID=A0ABQ7XBL5_BRANA|nr:hypothetical protein HID58_093978 [Brassica napus]
MGMIVTSALIIWKALMCVTGSESPVVVVLSGSMEPGFKRGRDIPIVHRVIKVHERENTGDVDVLTKGDNNYGDDRLLYAEGQQWLHRHHIMGRAVGFLPYVGWVTIIMTEKPIIKYILIGALDTALLSVVKDENLSVLHINDRSRVMRLWVTNKIDEEDAKDLSWRSDLVLEMDSAKFNLSVENFLLDEENKVAVCCTKFTSDRTMVYIVGEDMYKKVYEDTRDASPINWPVILTYVPSLVCLH